MCFLPKGLPTRMVTDMNLGIIIHFGFGKEIRFHTEAEEKLISYAMNGNLGILMISSYQGKQYALGIATNVFYNDSQKRKRITKGLKIYNYWKEIWDLKSVKNKFENNQNKFLKFWTEHYEWFNWRCPSENYYWFKKVILLKSEEIRGKKKLVTEYGKYQAISPEQAIEIIKKNIPKNHKCLQWLSSGIFDSNFLKTKVLIDSKDLRKKYKVSLGNSSSKEQFEYWVYGKRSIEPLHTEWQEKFVEYLKSNRKNRNIKKDEHFIDVRYETDDKMIFADIKPTEKIETKYAIRIAIGQLLEYRYYINKKAELEIVLSTKPKNHEIKFATEMGFILTYFDEAKSSFITL